MPRAEKILFIKKWSWLYRKAYYLAMYNKRIKKKKETVPRIKESTKLHTKSPSNHNLSLTFHLDEKVWISYQGRSSFLIVITWAWNLGEKIQYHTKVKDMCTIIILEIWCMWMYNVSVSHVTWIMIRKISMKPYINHVHVTCK